MSSQIGVPDYKENFNKENISKLNDLLTELNMTYSKLINKEAMDNRESDLYDKYAKQYYYDIKNLREVRDLCTKLSDACTDVIFDISFKAIHRKMLVKTTEE